MKRWLGLMIFLSACSSPQVVKPPLEKIEKIQRIAVQPFEGPGGPEVTQALLKTLAGSGLAVVDLKKNPDAVLTGSVSEYRTGRKVMIILGTSHSVASNGQKIDLSNPVVSLNASPLQNPALGNPQMVSERASVRVLAKLMDAPGGNMLWVGDSSYESLELPSALQTVVRALVQALQEAAPRLQHRIPVPASH
jgi:hypothetical protein